MNNDNNGVLRAIETAPPPFPPRLYCIFAVGFVSLLFMGFIDTLFTILFILIVALCWFGPNTFPLDDFEIDDVEDFDVEVGDRHAQNGNPLNNDRVMEILDKFFRVVKGIGRKQRKKNEPKKVLGSIECFGSQATAESGYSVCTICLEDFQKGEKCLVFPVCSHLFHYKCIVGWLRKKKLTCPVCRYCVASKAKTVREDRSRS